MPTSGAPFYAFGPFRLEPAERRLVFRDEPLPLPPKVLDTLVVLVEADGRLVAKEALMQRLWPDTVVEEVNLARNVSLLRKALADRDGRDYIETVPKSGYRFTAPVARIERPAERHEPSTAQPAGPKRPLTSGILASVLVATLAIAAIVAWRAGVWRSARSSGATDAQPNYVRATFDGTVVESVLSPDGSMVASVLRGPPMRLVLRDIATGSTNEALRGEFFFRPKWSPDGSAISVTWRPAVDKAGGLAIVPRLGGPPRVVQRSGFGAWSPDGKRLAIPYGRGFGVVTVDGTLVKEIPLTGFAWLRDLEWSRAGDRVLVWTEDDQHHTILWSVSPDDAGVRQIHAPGTQLLGAAWTPDASAIYVLKPVGETADLVRLPIDTRNPADEQVLIRGLTAQARGFSISADGSKLLFRRVTPVVNLWQVTVDDAFPATPARAEPLTRGTSRLLSPVISPDGRSIAFVREEAAGDAIHKAALPLDGPWERLTPAGLRVGSPAWSPDGLQIAFAASGSGGHSLWTVALRDGTRRQLSTAHSIDRDADSVVWAPDGMLAYQTPDHKTYYLIDPRNGEERRLGRTETGSMFTPRFSPDRSLVALYWNRRPSGPALWVIDLKTGAETLVAPRIVPMGWSPGNRAIYGVQALGEPEIVRVDRVTGARIVVTRFPFGVIESGSVSRDGRAIVCSVREDLADAWIIGDFDPRATPRVRR